MISETDVRRAHAACKMIELDGAEAFRTCCEQYGRDVATMLVVSFFRHRLNPEEKWPQEELEQEVNDALIEAGLIET